MIDGVRSSGPRRPVVRRIAGRVARELRSRWTRRALLSPPRRLVVEPGVTITGGQRIRLGEDVRLMAGSRLWATESGRIEIGPRTFVGSHSWLVSSQSIAIGADVLIAPFCYVQDTDHGFADLTVPIASQVSRSSPIIIEDGVWLGAHCVVTKGVRIGRGAVIGAGSVVTRDIPPNAIAVGSPARPIRQRGSGTAT